MKRKIIRINFIFLKIVVSLYGDTALFFKPQTTKTI